MLLSRYDEDDDEEGDEDEEDEEEEEEEDGEGEEEEQQGKFNLPTAGFACATRSNSPLTTWLMQLLLRENARLKTKSSL